MKNKKKQLLLKYLEKKNAQRKRDTLLERVRELQKDPKKDVISTSQIRRKMDKESPRERKLKKASPPANTDTINSNPNSTPVDTPNTINSNSNTNTPVDTTNTNTTINSNTTNTPVDTTNSNTTINSNTPVSTPVDTNTTTSTSFQESEMDHRDGIVDLSREKRSADSAEFGEFAEGEEEEKNEKGEKGKKNEKGETSSRSSTPLIVTSKKHARCRNSAVSLPITYMEDEIVSSVKENYITIISGGTGTGKSTQVPQFMHENGFAEKKKICITQPRRVSTQAVAQRIADEQKDPVGGVCGYKMRYGTHVSERTDIFVLTEGVLLQELAEDPFLSKYSVVILDEVHERSMTSDTLLMVLAKLAAKGCLRLVLMSAGITQEYIESVSRISRTRPNVVKVDPQTYEVQVHYLPLGHYVFTEEMVKRVELLEGKPGSILAFVATKEETEDVRRRAERITRRKVYTLHSDTPLSIQKEILQSTHALVVATNVAETSLTLPDVRYVIDGGREVQRAFSYGTSAYEYRTCMVSKSSAAQRLGRTGRTGPGVCYRLYTVVEHEKMEETRAPEILRERALLPISALLKAGVRPQHIPQAEFVTPPKPEAIAKEMDVLSSLQMVSSVQVTPFGERVLSLPLDPVLGASIVRVLERSPEALAIHLEILASIEVCREVQSKDKRYTVHRGSSGEKCKGKGKGKEEGKEDEREEKEDEREEREKESLSLVSFPELSPFAREKRDRLIEHLQRSLRRTSPHLSPAPITSTSTSTSTSSTLSLTASSIQALSWACRKNMAVLSKGTVYHHGEEVHTAAPLGGVDSSSPVPVLYHTLTRFSASKKVNFTPVIVPSYASLTE
ncbi:pre-mRNA-splicing factor ATP-dependent RNA helicase DHX16 [Nematocida sp. AWRm77]|nr:pre-mRNA-splicing factor ATP-dependent RNA helicase DHX16 [Nematocida sp. AWRm77]